MDNHSQSLIKDVKNFPIWKNNENYYYRYVKKMIQSFVPPDSNTLEVGAGVGKILSSTKPKLGIGIDLLAKIKKNRQLKIYKFDKQGIPLLPSKERFDFVIGIDLVEYLNDSIKVFNQLYLLTNKNSKFIILSVNSLWKPIIYLAKKINLTSLEILDAWISLNQLENIGYISNYKVIGKGYRLIFPKYIPVLSDFVNNIFYKIPLLKRLGLIQYIILSPNIKKEVQNLSCSVIVPCFNEEDNIEDCIKKCPKIGKFTELIIVDDGSTDRTAEKAKTLIKQYPLVRLVSYKKNKGKGYAVEKGMNAAKGDILMIWDADRTVPERDLNLFFQVLATDQARFANGTRLVYPMEDQAMKWLNLLGNKIFSVIFSWILSSPISDTLCGTKALLKKDYNKIKMGNEPWGDFDLLFGAAKLKLKIIEIPVHYKKRVAGESKMKVFKHGLLLAKMAFIGALRLKIGV